MSEMERLIEENRNLKKQLAVEREDYEKAIQARVKLRDELELVKAELERVQKQAAAMSGKRWGLYFASKVKHADKWLLLRDGQGVNVTSTWINEAGEGQSASYKELSVRCLSEIQQSQAVILYCEAGETLKGALIEAGAALALGVPVVCVGDCPSLSRVFKKHPLWSDAESIDAALVATKRGAALQPDAGSAPSRCTRCNAPFAPIEDDDNGLCVKCSLNPRPTKTAAGVGYSELKKQRDTLQDMLLQVTKQCDELKAKLNENEDVREHLENERKLTAEFRRRLETSERLLKESEVNLAGARAEREAVQKREAAMREALEAAHPARIWDLARQHYTGTTWQENGNNCITAHHSKMCQLVDSALQPDAGSDYIRRDQVKPLVDALTRINEISVIDEDMGCAVNWTGDALIHAKTIGFGTEGATQQKRTTS